MLKKDIVAELSKACEGQAFITLTQFSKALGIKDPKNAKKYLEDLEAVDGKYYLIRDVACNLKKRCMA